jgi:hypothetical protein
VRARLASGRYPSQALAEVQDRALDEAERMIAAAVAELRAEFAGQLVDKI